ncbi:universal stress protein [Anaerotalea alkaliphila]|uniref:Universal stress protein n=1 Tax=Anaerotalea alkaliphila TaxID=2662126 RepID=A0A7X5HX59_9FIRM|nr:universal stress protein [Anaerotalea alkaliphila]NDL68308.1 universal stress protein [Anaerotalea alkaliphila]
MFRKMIVETDLSAGSNALVDSLPGLRAYGAEECILVYCLNSKETGAGIKDYSMEVLEGGLQRQRGILERQGYVVRTKILEGLAKDVVNRLAVQEEADLIVAGAQEHSLTSEVLFSGATYDVMYHASVPVLMVRLEERKEAGQGYSAIHCNTQCPVLFPTDFSENALEAFGILEQMVAYGAGNVTLLHIQDQSRISPYLMDRLQEFNRIDQARLQELKVRLEDKGNVQVRTRLVFGVPHVEIKKVVEEEDIQLVVMGSRGRTHLQEFLMGSVSHRIARHVPACVLLVPPKPGAKR